jgi:hypothetical protein
VVETNGFKPILDVVFSYSTAGDLQLKVISESTFIAQAFKPIGSSSGAGPRQNEVTPVLTLPNRLGVMKDNPGLKLTCLDPPAISAFVAADCSGSPSRRDER